MSCCVTASHANSYASSSSSCATNLTPPLSLCLLLNSNRFATAPSGGTISIFHHGRSEQNFKASLHHCRYNYVSLRATNESSSATTSEASTDASTDTSEADKIVDGMDFGELCNEFECISSPSVESTARQLARDILELREGGRVQGIFAISVKYRDPVRSFTGREKYRRQLWAISAIENPQVSVQDMVMLSTSVLNIKWTVRGKPKFRILSIIGDLIIKVNSNFTLNQISGQVIEHEEIWDLSDTSSVVQLWFWISRRLFASVEAGKDIYESIKDSTNRFQREDKNSEFDLDPTGDPTKVKIHQQECYQPYFFYKLAPLQLNDICRYSWSSFSKGMMGFREICTKLHYLLQLYTLLSSS